MIAEEISGGPVATAHDPPSDPVLPQRKSSERIDDVWWLEMRREIKRDMGELKVHVASMQDRLREGDIKTDKHDQQLKELMAEFVEIETRMRKVEAVSDTGFHRRVAQLETMEQERTKREAIESAKIAAVAESSSQLRKLYWNCINTIAMAGAAGLAGFVWWLIATWIKAAKP